MLIKKSLIMFIDCILFMILLNLNSIEFGIEIFIKNVIVGSLGIIVIDIIFFIINYLKIEKQVKEFNKINDNNKD